MFPNITVLSRSEMIAHSAELMYPTVIVSITDVDSEPPVFADNPNIIDILYLFFDDEETGDRRMSIDDAQHLIDFVRQYENDDVALFFHCNAGVSRSAGCAAATMLIEWGDDSAIFNNGRYCPNMHCYRTILDVSDVTYDEIELAKKTKAQYELWREEYKEEYGL